MKVVSENDVDLTNPIYAEIGKIIGKAKMTR